MTEQKKVDQEGAGAAETSHIAADRLRPDDADRQRRASRRPFCGCCRARTFLLVARSIDATAAAVSGWREVFLETSASG